MLKKFFYAALIALGTAGIAATAVAAFVSTGAGLGTVLPGMAGAVIIAYALLHMLRRGSIIKIKWLRAAVTALVCAGIISFIAVEAVIISCAGGTAPLKNVNFVVVPGAGIFPDGRLTLALTMRLDKAYEYLLKHEESVCIVTGGQGANEPRTEAGAMKDYLVKKGIEPARIAEEGRSTDTDENMRFAAALMERDYPDREKSAVVVTGGYHMFRAISLARYNGITACGIASPSPWFLMVNDYMREYVGFFKMFILDLR